MANFRTGDSDVPPFEPHEPRPGASRLNQIVYPLNDLRRRFNERQRVPQDTQRGRESIPFKIVDVADGAGKYKVQMFHFPYQTNNTDDIAEDQLGDTVADIDGNPEDAYDAIAWNALEIDGTGSALTPGDTVYIGHPIGSDDDSKVVLIFSPGGGGSDSMGTRQYQQHVMVSDNEAGWDVARFASLLSNGD
ncbi:MAG TPA: hypothetical protein VH518_04185 [Tepidisphaeraceae bacterium]|jgi:hypothetical protein